MNNKENHVRYEISSHKVHVCTSNQPESEIYNIFNKKNHNYMPQGIHIDGSQKLLVLELSIMQILYVIRIYLI